VIDLFGDTITRPETIPARGIDNSAGGFIAFWSAWPAGPRKVAKQLCLNKWANLGCARSVSHICAHVEWMKTQRDWLDGFVCMPATYLNQQRWVDWEMPVAQIKAPDALEIIKSHRGAPMPASVRARLSELRSRV
jgi:hypothetical protein